MQNSHQFHSNAKRLRIVCLVISISLFVQASVLGGVVKPQDDPDRKQAFQLFKEGKYSEALPLFEKLEKAYPNDSAVLEAYGLVVFAQEFLLKDATERKQVRKRARELMVRARTAGTTSALVASLIESIPADGGNDVSFSAKKEVDEAMREGETAFAKGDYPKSIEMYQRALLLDPRDYQAALFTGDAYFQLGQPIKAGEWYGRAIQIDSSRETAYRYWGDVLMKQGHLTQAGEKFIEAYIADPYNRLTTAAFVAWGSKANIQLAHPNIEIPTNVTSRNGAMSITIDPNSLKDDDKSGSGAAWITYGLVRATWQGGEFAKQYPEETTYRHSLKEEVAALRAALKVLSSPKNADTQKSDPSLQALAKLDKEGLLEPFILLAMADQGIAKDFVAYRNENLAKLRKYVQDYVLTGGVGKN